VTSSFQRANQTVRNRRVRDTSRQQRYRFVIVKTMTFDLFAKTTCAVTVAMLVNLHFYDRFLTNRFRESYATRQLEIDHLKVSMEYRLARRMEYRLKTKQMEYQLRRRQLEMNHELLMRLFSNFQLEHLRSHNSSPQTDLS